LSLFGTVVQNHASEKWAKDVQKSNSELLIKLTPSCFTDILLTAFSLISFSLFCQEN